MSLHEKRFPNESKAYRDARNEILTMEVEMRSQIEKLGNMRAQLPLGGKIKEDYVFDELNPTGGIERISLSQMFAPGKQSLVVYSFMYSAEMEAPCPACTSIIDTLNANVPPITDRINLVVVGKSPINRLKEFAKSRSWDRVRLISSAYNSYNADYFAETDSGEQIPALNVFTATNDGVFHFFNTELLYVKLDGHPRHVDSIWPIWNLLDMTPEGRGTDWFPKLSYE